MKSLREFREERGIKQIAAANHLGVTRQTYATYEDNPERMNIAQAKSICAFIGCQVDDIYSLSDCPQQYSKPCSSE